MRTAIIGDIGGQLDVFHDVINNLGGNIETGKFPADLRVIQVGDIVRMNTSPDLNSLACAELADKLIDANDGNYIQLLGNHETPLLGGVIDLHWSITDLPESKPIINSWWNERKAHLALILHAPGEKDILVTHAGLTQGYMKNFLATEDVREAVTILNSFVGNVNLGGIEKPGALVTRNTSVEADIFWALCGPELHASWWGTPLGFNQIHGHAVVYRWDENAYWPDIPEAVIRNTLLNTQDRFTITQHPDGDWFRSVDWVLQNSRKRQEWPVLILDGFDVFLG
ncbi:MAG: hypothetical protein H9W81_01115 [Enterococcus sp.]|nr:hypothetical protein [Enterococcus sp.]